MDDDRKMGMERRRRYLALRRRRLATRSETDRPTGGRRPTRGRPPEFLWREAAPQCGLFAPSTSTCPTVPGNKKGKERVLDQRPLKPRLGVTESTYSRIHGTKYRPTSKKVRWADVAGGVLTHTTSFHPASSLFFRKPPTLDTSKPSDKRRLPRDLNLSL